MEAVKVEAPRLVGVIDSYRYDEIAQSLEITFIDGRRCVHTGVPLSAYQDFDASPQPGRFWALGLRHNRKGEPGYPMQMVE